MNIFQTYEEMITHIRALQSIAAADGEVSKSESLFINNLINAYYSSHPNFIPNKLEDTDDILIDSILSNISEEKNKWVLIQDLIVLSYVDGIFSDPERNKIQEFVMKMGLDIDKFGELEKLNQVLISTNYKIAELIGITNNK